MVIGKGGALFSILLQLMRFSFLKLLTFAAPLFSLVTPQNHLFFQLYGVLSSCLPSVLCQACRWSFFQFRLVPAATRVHVFELNIIRLLLSFYVSRLVVDDRENGS